MPRSSRIVDSSGGVYHIIVRGNNRKFVFRDGRDFSTYVGILHDAKLRFGFRLHHFVLMGNHVHLVMAPMSGHDLRHIMKRVNQGYSLHWKRRYGHLGHIWQDRFKSLIVKDDSYLLSLGAYIELNPVRANMVPHPDAYRWSSYAVYAHGAPHPLVDLHSTYAQLGDTDRERRAAYRALVAYRMQGTVPNLARQGTVPLGKVKAL